MKRLSILVVSVFLCTFTAGAQTAIELYNTAEQYYEAGNYTAALSKLDQTEKALGKSNVRIEFLRAQCYYGAKDYTRCTNACNTYLSFDPPHDSAYEKILKMQSDCASKKAQNDDFWNTATKQEKEKETAGAQVSSLTYYHITDKPTYTNLDYSKMNIEKNKDSYSVILPFTVTRTPQEGELFWLALYEPKGCKFSGWGIYNADNKFICRSFLPFNINDEIYILQAQPHLTEQIKQGKYTLKINFTEKPVNDVQISVGYSTQSIFDDYSDLLYLKSGKKEYAEGEKAYNDKDYAKAYEWWKKAADKGHVNAMYWLGSLYKNGQGVTRDYAKAREWFAKAADKGNEDAKKRLQEIDKLTAPDQTSQLIGTKWSLSFVNDDWVEIETGIQFLANKKVEWLRDDDDYGYYIYTDIGTYTFDGEKGVLKFEDGSISFSINGNKLTAIFDDGDRETFTKVSKFKYIDN